MFDVLRYRNYWLRFLENLCFLFGAAYFVAGSYPDGEVLLDEVDVEEGEEEEDLRCSRGDAGVHQNEPNSSAEKPIFVAPQDVKLGDRQHFPSHFSSSRNGDFQRSDGSCGLQRSTSGGYDDAEGLRTPFISAEDKSN